MSSNNDGIIVILSSPSGAGKTTLVNLLLQKKDFTNSVSHTTRKPRLSEVNGKDYHFISSEKFNTLVKKNEFYEHANIFDNYYGTHKTTVIKLLLQGKDVLFDIDWQGTQQLKKIKDLNIVTFFILPPNIEILRNRLLNRHKGEEKLIEKRMNKFNEEVSHWNEYNYVVINDDLDACYERIENIILSEKKGVRKKQNYEEIKKKVDELIK